jgi:hypothetical protein
MATNRKKLREQVLRRLKGGDPSVASNVHELEIDQAIMQVINSLIRPQYYETLQAGGTEAEGCVLCTYLNVAVTAFNTVSKSVLPAIPANLPRNQGVHRVYASTDVITGAFIPASSGELEYAASQRLLSDLLTPYAYKVRGKDIIYNKDLTAQSPAISSVTMELVVSDFSKYSDYELLPINADMEFQVVETVIKMFAPMQPQPNNIDSTNDTK